jgi:hypothetical protein
VGDAISFVTPEDQTALRSLERFIGRWHRAVSHAAISTTAHVPT